MATVNKKMQAALVLIASVWLNLSGQAFAAELPSVEEVLVEAPFNAKFAAKVRAGEIAATKVVPVSKSELAQGSACLVTSDAVEKIDAVEGATWLAPEKLILSSGRVPVHAVLEDFQAVQLSSEYEEEIEQFINARAGSDLNLSYSELAQFDQLKSSVSKEQQPAAVDKLVQSVLLARHQGYQENGLNGLAPYARKKGRQVQPLQQLQTSLEESLGLKIHYPTIYSLLERYPQTADSVFSEDYFWYMVELDDRPAVGLSHRVHASVDEARFIIERGYYISHSLESVQIVVAAIPVQEGLLLVYVNRTWTEKVAGFFTRLKKRIGYKIMMSEMEYMMEGMNICGAR